MIMSFGASFRRQAKRANPFDPRVNSNIDFNLFVSTKQRKDTKHICFSETAVTKAP